MSLATRLLSRIRDLLLPALLCVAGMGRAAPGDLAGFIDFPAVSPQDVARAPDGTFWVTTLLGGKVHRLSADLSTELESFDGPFGGNTFLTGIAYNAIDDTLFLAEATGSPIVEVDRTGQPTGRVVPLSLEPVVNARGLPTVRGLAFHAGGDDGRGSIFVVESVGTLIYEVALDGTTLRTFPHPDDPDGYPGEGASAPTADIEPIVEDGELRGFYLIGSRFGRPRLLRLDADGVFTGVSIPLAEGGGSVSGILRDLVPHPESGAETDGFVCVVESNARLAVLEAGEPTFREIFGLSCEAIGRDVHIEWTSRQDYERVTVTSGCDVLGALAGDATSFDHAFDRDGTYDLLVTVESGADSFSAEPCRVVVGPGQVLERTVVEAERPLDLAWDGEFFWVTEITQRVIHILDADLREVGTVTLPEGFAEEGDAITGIARGSSPETAFVYDTTTHEVGVVDIFGELERRFLAQLPDLADPDAPLDPGEEPEPDLGVVIGMTFDPTGDMGRGSLWVVEVTEDVLHEIDLDGRLLRSLPHPDRDRYPTPRDFPFGSASGGIALLSTEPTTLLLSGGTLREGAQRRIVAFDVEAESTMSESVVRLDGIRAATGTSSVTLEHVDDGGADRLLAFAYGARTPAVFELESLPSPAPPPRFLECRQVGLSRDVEIRFETGGPWDAVRVYVDCALAVELPGDITEWIDADVAPGTHTYDIRGVRGNAESDGATCELRVGAGALIDSGWSWPARSAQQVTRDPADGSFWATVDWPGDERLLFRYDAGLDHRETRESTLAPPWKISSLAARPRADAPSELYLLAWQQPVPLGEAGRESFLLVVETTDGRPLRQHDLDPPRPTNGFVTYPTALTWHPDTDTFWFLERNTRSFVHIDAFGEVLDVVPHPAPPFQNFVFNLGLTVRPSTGSLLFTTADHEDRAVGEIREMDSGGRLLDTLIPLRELPSVVRGIAWADGDLVVCAPEGLGALLRIATSSEVPAPWLRGDADHDGRVSLTDAVVTLGHLFRGGPEPACLDAADADDNGRLDITDPLVILRRLFLSGPPLPAPYPEPGQDPTPDGLACAATAPR